MKLIKECISHTDLAKPKVTYTHITQWEEKGKRFTKSEPITLEEYTNLQAQFGGTYYLH